MKLTGDNLEIVQRLTRELQKRRTRHRELELTYRGKQAIKVLGIAVPPELRGFEFPLNWNRVYVDAIEHRQDVKALTLPGEDREAESLRDGWDSNDMDAQAPLVHRDVLIHGHTFVSVGANDDDKERPLIRAESARYMIADVDQRRRSMRAALRIYSDPSLMQAPDMATLYLPDSTLQLSRDGVGPWQVDDIDEHKLGRVPVVMMLNRQLVGDWFGESEMADIAPLVTVAARTIMNLQAAQETIGVPKRYVLGATKGDFVGPDGKVRAEWQAYYDSLWAFAKSDSKVGQLPGADLKGFVDTITMLAQQASAVSGLPMRYFGQNPANPAAEGAIRADEARLVKNVERKNRDRGAAWGWTMGLYERIRTGEWPTGGRIGVEWHDPGTPTFAQRADAIQKLAAGTPILSREGAWDELGWTPERMARERGRFADQEADPYFERLATDAGV